MTGCTPPTPIHHDSEAEFRERYEVLAGAGGSVPPFHYGTHYSSAPIVAHYLVSRGGQGPGRGVARTGTRTRTRVDGA